MILRTEAWLDHHVGPSLRERLNSVTVPLNAYHSKGFLDLMLSWHSHVSKLVSDLELPPGDERNWGPHDLIAGLIIRDAVEKGLRAVPRELMPPVNAALADVDQAFAAYSEPDDCGCTQRVDRDVTPSSGWWWRRVPLEGLVREELERYYGHPRMS